MVSVLIKHAGFHGGGRAVCVCVRSTTFCIMDRAEVLRMKLTTLQLWLLFPLSHTHFHCSAKVIDCFYRMTYACLCVFVVRQVDSACTESERRSQAGRQAAAVLGLPFGAKGFLPLFPSSPSLCVSWIFTPEALCRQERLPSTHSRFLHSRPIQHPPTGHRWLSKCQKKYTVKWNIQREV